MEAQRKLFLIYVKEALMAQCCQERKKCHSQAVSVTNISKKGVRTQMQQEKNRLENTLIN